MSFISKARNLRCSPYKLRSLADVVRGKDAKFAIHWLDTCRVKKAEPVKKAIQSAVANAKDLADLEMTDLFISEIKIDQGPIYKYYKPGAMGRANPQRKRFSHISVKVASKNKK
ncbi:50S ribosomal protein L22 [candidate division TM6 bacterium RIFCSPHIGHO2_12_FULL_32_22]|nr:MAG: 50S ribosomal protein L22 [candidate division TM6 bacterium RIFCSPHIGHO2_12_FULL_32_22]